MTHSVSDWRGRSVLVTGCTGLLGSWLCRRLLNEGATVIGLSRRAYAGGTGLPPAVALVQGGLDDGDLIRGTVATRGVDTVFHLAAQPLVPRAAADPAGTFETNVRGTWSLLEALRCAGRPVRVVVASSEGVYGDSPSEVYTEDSPPVASRPYAISKICAETIARGYREHFDQRVGVARMSHLYGGGDLNFDRLIPGVIRAVLRDERPTVLSDGTPERDYLYVEDAVDGCLRIATALDRADVPEWTFNLGCEQPVSVTQVVSTVLARMGRTDLEPRILGQPTGSLSRTHSSCARAKSALGWHATVSLECGIEKTIPWYREHAEEVRP